MSFLPADACQHATLPAQALVPFAEALFHLSRGPAIGPVAAHGDQKAALRALLLSASLPQAARVACPRLFLLRGPAPGAAFPPEAADGGPLALLAEVPLADTALQSNVVLVRVCVGALLWAESPCSDGTKSLAEVGRRSRVSLWPRLALPQVLDAGTAITTWIGAPRSLSLCQSSPHRPVQQVLTLVSPPRVPPRAPRQARRWPPLPMPSPPPAPAPPPRWLRSPPGASQSRKPGSSLSTAPAPATSRRVLLSLPAATRLTAALPCAAPLSTAARGAAAHTDLRSALTWCHDPRLWRGAGPPGASAQGLGAGAGGGAPVPPPSPRGGGVAVGRGRRARCGGGGGGRRRGGVRGTEVPPDGRAVVQGVAGSPGLCSGRLVVIGKRRPAAGGSCGEDQDATRGGLWLKPERDMNLLRLQPPAAAVADARCGCWRLPQDNSDNAGRMEDLLLPLLYVQCNKNHQRVQKWGYPLCAELPPPPESAPLLAAAAAYAPSAFLRLMPLLLLSRRVVLPGRPRAGACTTSGAARLVVRLSRE